MAATKRTVSCLAAAVVLLLFLLLIVWLAVKTSTAFYIIALLDFTAIISIFLWLLVRHASEDLLGPPGSWKPRLAAYASVVAFVTLVVLLWVRVLGPRKAFYLTGAGAATLILSLLSWVVVSWAAAAHRRHRAGRGEAWEEEVRLEYNFLRRFAGLPMEFSYEELVAATEDFRSLVGKGGCSSVFKGVLDDGTPAAVKRIERESRLDREFRSEVAAIASVQHVNLVRLLGYCLAPEGQRFLVYEFFPNGSLDAWIFGKCEGSCLTWRSRYQVSMDVARSLAYLHHDCRSKRVLHLDIKPENILLDATFRACVSDFGMSRLVAKEETTIYTTIRGTRGYFAPEWFSDAGVSHKSDVYSFGLVLMEMVGGRRNVDTGAVAAADRFFPRVVNEKVREGRVMEVVDPRLLAAGDVEEGEVGVVVRVALWCIQDKPELRPSMAAVVDMLRGYVAVDVPPESPMFMADLFLAPTETQPPPSRSSVSLQAATSIADEMNGDSRRPLVTSSSSSISRIAFP